MLYFKAFQGMNTVPPLRVAIVGCGSHGFRCADLLGEARLVVVCDTNPRRAASLAATAHACFATNELSEALSFRPDAVIVTTPPISRPQIAVEALKAGSHVFLMEQPVNGEAEWVPVQELALRARRLLELEPDGDGEGLAVFLGRLQGMVTG